MIQIRKEAEEVIQGTQPKDNNILKNAPHPISVMTLSDAEWNRYVHSLSGCALSLTIMKPLLTSTSRIPHALALRKEVLAHCFTN